MYYGCNQIKESWPLSQVHIYVGHVCHLQSSVSFSFLKMIKLWNFNFFLARGIFLCKQSWKSFTEKVKRISIPLMMSNKIAKVVDCANCGKAGDIFVCWTHFFYNFVHKTIFSLTKIHKAQISARFFKLSIYKSFFAQGSFTLCVSVFVGQNRTRQILCMNY